MRLVTALFATAIAVAGAGCQCSPLLRPSGDLIDDISDHPPRAEWLYSAGWDLNRIGKPDWCAKSPFRGLCRRRCQVCRGHIDHKSRRCSVCAQIGLDVTQNPLTRGLPVAPLQAEPLLESDSELPVPPTPMTRRDVPAGGSAVRTKSIATGERAHLVFVPSPENETSK